MIKINKTLGESYDVDLDDVYRVKSAFKDIGYYKVPSYGLTKYPDTHLYNAVREFQRDENLRIDGVMRPDGETIQALNSKLPDHPGVKRPDMRCPVCGGWHGGSMGDLCPDCTSK